MVVAPSARRREVADVSEVAHSSLSSPLTRLAVRRAAAEQDKPSMAGIARESEIGFQGGAGARTGGARPRQ